MKFNMAAIKKLIEMKNSNGQHDTIGFITRQKLIINVTKLQKLRFREYVLDAAASTSTLALPFHFAEIVTLLEYEATFKTAVMESFMKLERRVIKVVRKSTSTVPRTP